MADLQEIRLSGTTQELAERLNGNFTEVELRKVDRELKTGSESVYKELTDNNYTDDEKSKLGGIENGAEVNIIETVKVNDVALIPTERAVNITVPVNASDVNALPDTTKYGATVDLTYTSETGVLGISLKDQDGTELGSDTVDLPMELIIQSGTVETCTVDDVPVVGYVVGDKYLDLLLANDNHIYVLVSDLIDQITIQETGTGNAVTDISISGNVITETKGKTFVETSIMSQITKTIYVDKNRIDTYTELGTETYPFKTIVSAISYVISLNYNGYVNIEINNGIYAETISLENEALKYIVLTGKGYVSINPASGNALQSTTGNANLFALHINNIIFSKPIVLTGANGTSAFTDVVFNNVNFNATGTINATCINNITFRQCYNECDIAFNNVNSCYTESSQLQGNLAVTSDSNENIPSQGGNFTMIASGVYLSGVPTYTIGGTSTQTFAITGSRWGATRDVTIPTGVTVYAYSSFIRGTNTNNGSIVLRSGSTVENYVAGTGTLTLTGNDSKFNYYDNSTSGLTATNVKEAIDELNTDITSTTVISEEFTADDIRWSELTEGYYTLTIVSAKTPISSAKKLISGTNYGDVLATVTSDGTNIYVISDTKFAGKILTV